MQKICLIGNLGNDARVVNGRENDFISFSVACNRTKGNEKVTVWYNCTYNPSSLKIAEYLTKGTQVYLEGFPTSEVYQNSPSIKVNVNMIQLLGSKSD